MQKILILAETVFNFHALAYASAYSKTMSWAIADHAKILILAEMVFNFYQELMISGRSCADAPLAGGMGWMTIWCQAALLTRFTKKCASCAHSPRTYAALKRWCNVAEGPMELHFLHAALGTSCISWFVLHTSRRCQATKLITWDCQYSTFLLCLTRSERVSSNKIDSLEVPTFNVSTVFYTLCENAGWQTWFSESAHISRFYCVLHTLRRWWVTKLILWECPDSTFL